jgi:hypothetical protein
MTTSSTPSAPADTNLSCDTTTSPIRIPSADRIAKAAWELARKWRWSVTRCIFPVGEFAVSGPDIDKYSYGGPPTASGKELELARWIVVRALVARTEALTPAIVDEISADIEPDELLPRDYLVLQRCKGHIQRQVVAMALYGGPGPDGEHLEGPEALLHFLGVPYTASSARSRRRRERASATPFDLLAEFEVLGGLPPV